MNAKSLIIPAILAVFSVLVIWASLQLDLSPDMIVGDSMQPRAFPIFLMVINLVLIAVLVAQVAANPPEPVAVEPFATWGSMGVMVVFFVLANYADLFIGIAVAMYLLCWLWGERRIIVAGATALITCISIFLLFDMVLRVRFPRGIIIDWYYG